MATEQELNYVLNFIVNKAGQAEALAALKTLEAEGVKFNQKAGRFIGSGGKFLSQENIRGIYQNLLAEQGKVAQQAIASRLQNWDVSGYSQKAQAAFAGQMQGLGYNEKAGRYTLGGAFLSEETARGIYADALATANRIEAVEQKRWQVIRAVSEEYARQAESARQVAAYSTEARQAAQNLSILLGGKSTGGAENIDIVNVLSAQKGIGYKQAYGKGRWETEAGKTVNRGALEFEIKSAAEQVQQFNAQLENSEALTAQLGKGWVGVANEVRNFATLFDTSLEEAAKQTAATRAEVPGRLKAAQTYEDEARVVREAAAALRQKQLLEEQEAEALAQREKALKRQINEEARLGRMGQRVGIGLLMGGIAATQVGTALTAPMEAYIRLAGYAEEKSRAWNAAQRAIEQNTAQIGRNMADVLTPLEAIKADFLAMIASSKGLSAAAGGVGAFAKGIGGVATTAGQAMFSVAALENIRFMKEYAALNEVAGKTKAAADTKNTVVTEGNTKAKLAEMQASLKAAGADLEEAAASKAAGASKTASFTSLLGKFGIMGAAFLAGSVAVYGLVSALRKVDIESGRYQKRVDEIREAQAQGKKLYPGYMPVETRQAQVEINRSANAAAREVNGLTGALASLGLVATNVKGKIDVVIPEAAISAYASYRQQEVQAEKQNSAQRAQIVADGAQQRAELEQQGEQRRNEIVAQYTLTLQRTAEDRMRADALSYRDFFKEESQSLSDHYRQRAQMVKDGNEEIQRIERDHQREMQKMIAEHNLRVEDLIDAGDALGLLREEREFRLKQQFADQDVNEQIRQRREDLGKRLQEQSQEFELMRQRRLADFQQRMADQAEERAIQDKRAAADHEAELKRLEEEQKENLAQLERQRKEKLTQLQKAYNDERQQRAQALAHQLMDLNTYLGVETDYRARYYAYWEVQYKTHLDNISGMLDDALKSTQGERASGGYVGAGLYRMHPHEYVLNDRLTTLAEKMSGGARLSNEVLEGLIGGASGGAAKSITIRQEFAFSGLYDKTTEKRIREVVYDVTQRTVEEVLT